MSLLPGTIFVLGLSLAANGPWNLQESGTKARFRGLSVVNAKVAWASGSQGTCVRTIDGGSTWKVLFVPDSSTLDFRDIQAFDEKVAYLLSIGAGELSRIFKTTDGGESWSLQFTNRDPNGFLDAISFWDADHGLALGDPVDGRYTILKTDDGGKTWSKPPTSGMPEALPGEGAFAASGTCLITQGTSNAWFATGGGATARVFRSTDHGQTWTVANTPIRAGIASAGIFSLAFRDAQNGIAVGGDYKSLDDPTDNLAFTTDGGRTWTAAAGPNRPAGFRSAVAYASGSEIITVGPAGSDVSQDGGRTWSKLDGPGFHALGIIGPKAAWAVGEGGRIGKLEIGAVGDR